MGPKQRQCSHNTHNKVSTQHTIPPTMENNNIKMEKKNGWNFFRQYFVCWEMNPRQSLMYNRNTKEKKLRGDVSVVTLPRSSCVLFIFFLFRWPHAKKNKKNSRLLFFPVPFNVINKPPRRR